MSTLILKDIKDIYNVPQKGTSLSILIQDDRIERIGTLDAIQKSLDKTPGNRPEIVDCSRWIILPGLIDCHTHLLFAGSREKELYMRASGRPYMDILKSGGGIYNTVKAVREASEEDLIKNGIKYLDRALKSGLTTIEIKSGYGLDYENEKKMLKVIRKLNDLHPVDVVPTFLVHTVPKEMDRKVFIDLVAEKMIPEFRDFADWFDIFLEKDVFDLKEGELLIRRAMDEGYHVGIHTNQVNDIGGVKLADDLGVRHVDHLEVLTAEDADRIRKNKDLYAVFLPTAEAYVFSEHVGQMQQLMDVPSRLVLSSDFNPGSSPVLSPFVVISHALLRYRIPSPSLLLDGFTSNPADMLYLGDRGTIQEGKKADLVCLSLDNFHQVPYLGTLPVIDMVIKDGKIYQAGS
jgi:imidazolonepropionase